MAGKQIPSLLELESNDLLKLLGFPKDVNNEVVTKAAVERVTIQYSAATKVRVFALKISPMQNFNKFTDFTVCLILRQRLACSTMGGPANSALQAEAATDKAPLTSPPAMLFPWGCLWKNVFGVSQACISPNRQIYEMFQ